MRFRSDMYFEKARKTIPLYVMDERYMPQMRYMYLKSIENNPLEFYNYSNILNGHYFRIVARKD